MNNMNINSIRIERIQIKNYKGIDSCDLLFPFDDLHLDDADIFVMGSKNGLGKSSVIECCAITLTCLSVTEKRFELDSSFLPVNIWDLIIRSGKRATEIVCELLINNQFAVIEIEINHKGVISVSKSGEFEDLLDYTHLSDASDILSARIGAICGFNSNPVIDNNFLLFHSYRKIQEGNPNLGVMVRDRKYERLMDQFSISTQTFSEFKIAVLRSILNQTGVFESVLVEYSEEALEVLSNIVNTFTGGEIGRPRLLDDNAVELRVLLTKSMPAISFDGLSSGQKEIISTLFLIWFYTRNNPSVVFIDEPELHLNAGWHRKFINNLIGISPNNQYIIATHSEAVMDSVHPYHQIYLREE